MKTTVQTKNHQTSIILEAENQFEQDVLDRTSIKKGTYKIDYVSIYEKIGYNDKNIMEISINEKF